MTESRSQPLTKQASWAALRWGVFVTLFLIAQMGLAYAAIKCAGSDGGEYAIPGADEAITRSYNSTVQD